MFSQSLDSTDRPTVLNEKYIMNIGFSLNKFKTKFSRWKNYYLNGYTVEPAESIKTSNGCKGSSYKHKLSPVSVAVPKSKK